MASLRLAVEPSPAAPLRWPDALGFQEALQSLPATVSIPELAAGEVRLDRIGLPLAFTGRFAVVFPVRDRAGSVWALRCFTTAGEPSRGERSAALQKFFQENADALRGIVVPFRVYADGVRVGTARFPAVVMPWVSGTPLGRWVEEHARQPGALLRLAASLSELHSRLLAVGMAHGDWQHDNLIVSEQGSFVTLVDYDGVYLPSIAHLPPRERGHPNYQHPARSDSDYGPGMDAFACLLIQTALVGIACDSTLHGAFADGESVIFRRSDLADPENSPAFAALRQITYKSGALRQLLPTFEEACRSGIVPPTFDADIFRSAADELEVEFPAEESASPRVEAVLPSEEAAVLSEPIKLSRRHRRWMRVARRRLRRQSVRGIAHRVGVAAALLLCWLFRDSLGAFDAGTGTTVPCLCAAVLAIGYYLWPRNQDLLETMASQAKCERKAAMLKGPLQAGYAELGEINARPEMRSVVAFAGAALRAVTLADISVAVGMVPFEYSLFHAASVHHLGDVTPALDLPQLRPGLVDAANAYRSQVTAAARMEYDALADRRRELQREVTRMEAETAEMLQLRDDYAKRAAQNAVSFPAYLISLILG